VTDVVIAGYGPAGAAAAIAAHDAGRSVLVLESAERGGGNARYSGGFLFDVPGDAAIAHLDALCFGRTDRRVLEAYAAGRQRRGLVMRLSSEFRTTIFRTRHAQNAD